MNQLRVLSINQNTNLEEIVENYYDEIRIVDRTLNDTIEILEKYGGSVKKFKWTSTAEIKSSDVIKVLNLMPLLEEIKIDPIEGFTLEASNEILNLPHLKSLIVSKDSDLELFTFLLPQNCIKQFKMKINRTQDDKENLSKFVNNQKLIKICKIEKQIDYDALKVLTLEEVKLGMHMEIESVLKVIKWQPELKTFQYLNFIDSKTLRKVCKLSKLETLKITVFKIEDVKCLEKLKNLKYLKLYFLTDRYDHIIFAVSLKSVERLKICMESSINNSEILEMISENLPNLKVLELESSQKLNLFAKIFQKLEELSLHYFGENSWEFDTGIVNENIKKLFLNDRAVFCHDIDKFFDIIISFPNLEVLKVRKFRSCENYSKYHAHSVNRNFFAKLNTVNTVIKSIDLSLLKLKIDQNELMEVCEEIKKLAKKFEFVRLDFNENFRNLNNQKKRTQIISYYDLLIDEIKDDYKIYRRVNTENFNDYFYLTICTQDFIVN